MVRFLNSHLYMILQNLDVNIGITRINSLFQTYFYYHNSFSNLFIFRIRLMTWYNVKLLKSMINLVRYNTIILLIHKMLPINLYFNLLYC